jgi:hypothetical protein
VPLVQEAIWVPSRDTTRVMVASPAPLTWIVLFPVFVALNSHLLVGTASAASARVPNF